MLFQSCKSLTGKTVIYENVSYKLENASDREKIMQLLNTIVADSNIKAQLNTFSVLKSIDENTQKEYTYLLGTNEKKSHKVAVLLQFNATKNAFEIEEKIFIVCYGTTDCSPSLYNNRWDCDAGTETFKCIKSIIVIE